MSWRVPVLFVGDLLLALCAMVVAYYLRLGAPDAMHVLSGDDLGRASLFVGTMLFSSFLVEIYALESHAPFKDIVSRALLALMFSFVVLATVFYIIPPLFYGRGVLVLSLSLFALLQCFWHISCRVVTKIPVFSKRVLILGTGPLAKQIGSLFNLAPHSYVLCGYVNCTSEAALVPSSAILGCGESLYETVKSTRANKIVVSLSERRGVFPVQDVLSCKLCGVEVMDAPSFYEKLTGKLLIENINPSWFIFSSGFRVTALNKLLKRVLDISAACFGLIFCLPIMPVLAVIIKLDSPGPVFFRQVRVGERERQFSILKFRTMRQDAESATGAVWATKNDPRITRIGGFLRKSRLDELPQLFNVLLGEMSLVGPRPERPEFVSKLKEIIPYYSERHFVKPGVTGWAQVRYPYGASIEDAIEKLRYDLYYIKNLSLLFDVKVLLDTIKVVLFRRGGR